jgi:methionyl-tRNA synthetase
VHDYLTVGGRRISKSAQAARAASPAARAALASSAGQVSAASADGGGGPGDDADPAVLASRYGSDAVRWWLLRDVPQAGDADFTPQRLVGRANTELAGVIGNLISRVGALVQSYRGGEVPGPPLPGWPPGTDLPAGIPQPAAAADLLAACARASARISAALTDYDFRAATSHVLAIADAANRYAERAEPWHLARAELAGDTAASAKLDAVLWLLAAACQLLGATLEPFLPALAGRIRAATSAAAEPRPQPVAVFPRIS